MFDMRVWFSIAFWPFVALQSRGSGCVLHQNIQRYSGEGDAAHGHSASIKMAQALLESEVARVRWRYGATIILALNAARTGTEARILKSTMTPTVPAHW